VSLELLYLRLEGPLQSWGDDAQWTVRRTRPEPTKSGVLGMVAAASGWGLDAAGDARVAELAGALRMAVRADQAGTLLRDYHTVTGTFRQADGKYREKTELSDRYYLADARFLVALSGPSTLLDQVEGALLAPEWPVYLGRKSCPPSAPPVPALPGRPTRGRADSLLAAVTGHPWLPRAAGTSDVGERREPVASVVIELEAGEPAPPGAARELRRDVPLSLSRRLFGERFVYEKRVDWSGSG
jgi:CRISPR system Cascade subunit CasD